MFIVTVNFLDAKGKTSSTSFNVPVSLPVDFIRLVTYASDLTELIEPLVRGAITSVTVAYRITLPAGLKATPMADSDVEEGARFQFRTVGNYATANRLPTFDEAYIVAGGADVDLADPDVAAFVAALADGIEVEAGPPAVSYQASDTRAADIVALSFAREQFLRSR